MDTHMDMDGAGWQNRWNGQSNLYILLIKLVKQSCDEKYFYKYIDKIHYIKVSIKDFDR